MDLPSSAHFIYIPLILTVGVVLGFVIGARITQESHRLEAKRLEERAQKKAARALERESARQSAGNQGGTSDPPT